MPNKIFKTENLSDFSYFLLKIRKILVKWIFLAHFYASNFVNRLFLQRSQKHNEGRLKTDFRFQTAFFRVYIAKTPNF